MNKKDKCVSCGIETKYDEFDHIDIRNFYIEGTGQLCCDCYDRVYNAMSTRPRHEVDETSIDFGQPRM